MKSYLLSVMLAATLAACVGAQMPLFRSPVRLPAPVNDALAQDVGPEISSDLLRLYFSSNRSGTNGGQDIWMSSRADLCSTWGPPVNVRALNSSGDDWMGALRADELEAIFASNRVVSYDLFASTRTSTAAAWGSPILLGGITTIRTQGGVSMTGDGLEAYFHSQASGLFQILRMTRASLLSTWSTPVVVPELAVGGSWGRPHGGPAISNDGLQMIIVYLSSWPSSSYDFYHATRTSRTGKFRAPVLLPELNTYMNSSQGHWTRDGFSFYHGIKEMGDIYRADLILPICIPSGQPTRGQPFDVACRRDPGDVGVVVGSLKTIPQLAIPGAQGRLEIDPVWIVWQATGPVGCMGRFTTRVPVPNVGALKGVKVYWQAGAQDPRYHAFISPPVATEIQ